MLRSFFKLFRPVHTLKYDKITIHANKAFVRTVHPYTTCLKLAPVILGNSQKYYFIRGNYNFALALSILGWLGFKDDDEEKESELIMTLKRSVLATHREQYDKAEQLLHVALRIAQQQQNEQGILYCYDLMANVAFNRLELNKAEKLFVSVLQMLLSNGTKQDDLKVCHLYVVVLQ